MKRNHWIIFCGIIGIIGITGVFLLSVLFTQGIPAEPASSMAAALDTPTNRVIAIVSLIACLIFVLCCFIARE